MKMRITNKGNRGVGEGGRLGGKGKCRQKCRRSRFSDMSIEQDVASGKVEGVTVLKSILLSVCEGTSVTPKGLKKRCDAHIVF